MTSNGAVLASVRPSQLSPQSPLPRRSRGERIELEGVQVHGGKFTQATSKHRLAENPPSKPHTVKSKTLRMERTAEFADAVMATARQMNLPEVRSCCACAAHVDAQLPADADDVTLLLQGRLRQMRSAQILRSLAAKSAFSVAVAEIVSHCNTG